MNVKLLEVCGQVVGTRSALTPIYESRCASFNDSTGFYELNGLTDLTVSEILDILYISNWGARSDVGRGAMTRTLFRPPAAYTNYLGSASSFALSNFCYDGNMLEVVDITPINAFSGNGGIFVASMSNGFYNCKVLKKIIGSFKFGNTPSNITSPAFSNCPLLEEVRFTNIGANIWLGSSPRITEESILHAIKNYRAAITSPITLTLHSTAYTRAIENSEIQAALESTNGMFLIASV